MGKRFNLRFALYLAGALAVLGTATHFLHAYQVRRTSGAMLDRAGQVEAAGELERAADYLGRYVSLNPDDTDTLARYGAVLADGRLATSPKAKFLALRVLNKVLYRAPSRQDVRRQVVRLSMDLRQFGNARDDLNRLAVDFPRDGEINNLLGRCEESFGNYRDARQQYQLAVVNAPHDVDGYDRLARLLRNQPDAVRENKLKEKTPADVLKRADAEMDDMVAKNPKAFQAYLLRAAYRRTYMPRRDNQEKATALKAAGEDVAAAQKLAPEEVDVCLAAADQAWEQGQKDEARRLLRHGRDRRPKDWRLHSAAARLEEKVDAALSCLDEGLRDLPGQLDLLWQKADLLTAAGRKGPAEEVIAQLEKQSFPDAFLDCLRGRLLMLDEAWSGAVARLEGAYASLAARNIAPGDVMTPQIIQQTGLWLGQCYEQIGDLDRAADAYGRVLARDGRSVAGHSGIASVRRAQGRVEEALDQYRQVMKIGAPDGVAVEAARVLLLANLQREEGKRDWPQVNALLEQLEKNVSVPAVAVLWAEYWAGQGQFDQARQALIKRHPDPKTRPAEVWVALAAVEERRVRPESALAVLDESDRYCGDRAELRAARAGYWIRRGPAEARKSLPPLLAGLDKFSAADRHRLLSGLGTACLQAGLTEEAGRLWEQLANEKPKDLRSRVVLFDLAVARGDDAAAGNWLKSIREIEGIEGVFWRYARASQIVVKALRGGKEPLDEARRLIDEIRTVRQADWSRAVLLEAEMSDIEGRSEVALGSYLRAIRMGERDPSAISRAVVLLHKERRDAEATALLAKLPKATLMPQDTQRAAAELALHAGDLPRAVALAQQAVAAESNNHRDHLWLAYMYWVGGQADRAEKELVRARDLAPTAPETWTSLIQWLVSTGRKEKAVAAVTDADRRLTAPADVTHLAICHELVDQKDRARELYEKALRAAGNDPAVLRAAASFYLRNGQPAPAKDLLARLSRHPDFATRAWARRTQAVLLADKGDPAHVREALALLDTANGGSADRLDDIDLAQDQRIRARLLAMQSVGSSRRTAVNLLDGLIDRHMAVAEDYLLAAQLHEAAGDWSRARQQYIALLGLTGGPDVATLATAARSLLRHGDRDAGRQFLDRLERAAPTAAATNEIRARVGFLEGQAPQARELVRESARLPDGNPRAAAEVLEEFGDLAGAEELFRTFAARTDRRQNVLPLVYFLIRHDRCEQALELCDKCWATCPTTDVAQACLFAVSKGTPSPEALGRLAARLEVAIAAAPDQVNLLAALAAVRNFQGRYDEAIGLYRRVLAKDPGHMTAMNNLAWLLALKAGHGSEAVEWVNKATAAAGLMPGLLDTRAVANLTVGGPDATEAAVRDLEQLVIDAPSPTAFFHLARAYEKLGRKFEAGRAWDAAKKKGLTVAQLHPLERDAYEKLARSYK